MELLIIGVFATCLVSGDVSRENVIKVWGYCGFRGGAPFCGHVIVGCRLDAFTRWCYLWAVGQVKNGVKLHYAHMGVCKAGISSMLHAGIAYI